MFLALSSYIMAQLPQTERGRWKFDPQITAFNVGGSDNGHGKNNKFKMGLAFNGGSFVYDNLLLNIGIGFQVDKQDSYKNNNLQFSAGMKYYILSRLFLGGEFGYERKWYRDYDASYTRKNNYVFFAADLGYAIFITRNFSIEPALYWKHSFADRLNEYGFKIGFGLYF